MEVRELRSAEPAEWKQNSFGHIEWDGVNISTDIAFWWKYQENLDYLTVLCATNNFTLKVLTALYASEE
jgi:hypothetical protein